MSTAVHLTQAEPISLLICALGGEGGGVLSEWIVSAARHAGYAAQSTSIPGVAQRTGATTYYIEVFPVPLAQLQGQRPVLSLQPVPGALDALLSSELLETTRQISNGLVSRERTLVISTQGRALTTAERVNLGDGRYSAQALVEQVQAHSRAHQWLALAALARTHQTAPSAVMLGALAASALLPFERAHYQAAIEENPAASTAASLRGFAAAYEQGRAEPSLGAAASQASHSTSTGTAASSAANATNNTTNNTAATPTPDPLTQFASALQALPPAVQTVARLGLARLLDYQGVAYAQLYLKRLQSVVQAEQTAAPDATSAWAISAWATSAEVARWLALWMAFDDVVRVAELKNRASRWARVVREVKAQPAELVKLYDHFKPGVAEFAGLLPRGLARHLLAWDARRVARGRAPWALPLKIASHSLTGMAALRLLASLKWWRPRGSRYAHEQALIEQWLQALCAACGRSGALAYELALCGRLIKGYGASNERGKQNLLHIVTHLAQQADASLAAQAVAAARTAALSDEAGQALDATLLRYGAPARPVPEQVLRFMPTAARRAATPPTAAQTTPRSL